ncbi:carbonic anhydrase 13 [Hydra vulgaris]|uniref:carbonic anhydrase 13 n=1 Tax=Hydra vulgaris TaxID=6087 RepID=UPI001F5FC99B|nr:carbonic anhydrase 13-like [Hydra vulgaris]
MFEDFNTLDDPDWDYSKEHGPHQWSKYWNFTKRQSPINLNSKLIKYNSTLKPLHFDKKSIKLEVKNIGKNISFSAENNAEIIFSGGYLKNRYAFREMHFHWGEVRHGKCDRGCEHTIDGNSYSAEMHIVHWNVDLYKTELEALKSPNGLAVLGLFIDAKEIYEQNESFELVINMFNKVPYINYKTKLEVSPYFLVPSCTKKFYTYPGSLTIPPLTENVTWILLAEPIKISIDQLDRMTTCTSDSGYITNNYRPIQPLNNRVIQSSFV